jgi:hypothetical protein
LLLIYAAALVGVTPTPAERGEVDHIITQGQFSEVPPDVKRFQHHAANLQVLPARVNESRGGTRLDLLRDPTLRDPVEKFSRIKKEDFARYAQVTQAHELTRDRGAMLRHVLCELRESFVSDPKQFEGPSSDIWVTQVAGANS